MTQKILIKNDFSAMIRFTSYQPATPRARSIACRKKHKGLERQGQNKFTNILTHVSNLVKNEELRLEELREKLNTVHEGAYKLTVDSKFNTEIYNIDDNVSNLYLYNKAITITPGKGFVVTSPFKAKKQNYSI